MARVSRKKAAAPDDSAMVLPYGSVEAAAPERAEAAPAPPYRAPPATTPSVPFAAWLLKQDKRDGWIGALAKALFAIRSDAQAARAAVCPKIPPSGCAACLPLTAKPERRSDPLHII